MGPWRKGREAPGDEPTEDQPTDERLRRIATRRARAEVAGAERRVGRVESTLEQVRVDLECMASQLRAIEHRLADDEARPAATAGAGEPGSGGEAAEAAAILEQVRREHEQVRARFQAVARYEERLRRVEEAVVTLYGGDLRGPGPGSQEPPGR